MINPCWLPGDIDLTPGTPCLIYGRRAVVVRRSIYPDRVYVDQDHGPGYLLIGPDWYNNSNIRPFSPQGTDPSVVLA
jgi:hypothetical protein